MLLKRRAMMFQHGSTPQRRLPYDYQELAYIESTGTQYIDPDFSIVAETDDLSIEASWTSTGTIQIVGGVKTSSPITRYAIFQQMADNCIGFDIRDSSGTNRISSSIQGYGSKHFIVISKNKLTIDGSYIGQSAGVNPLSQKIIYFGVCNTTTSPFTNSLYPSRIYHSCIERNGSLIRNLIPAMRYSDKVAGLYDTVNDVFYTNQGTGEFKMGPLVPYRLPEDFQEVEYIGSTKGGGQYISTGYTGSECIVTCKTKFVEQPTGLAYIFGRYSSTASHVLGLMSGSSATVFRVGMGPGVNSIVPLDTNIHTIVLNAFAMEYSIDSEIGSLGSSLIGEDGRDICLFVNHTSSMANPSYANIYEFKIEDTTGIALNLVPCYRISDGAVGMYDTVNNTFKTNSGSGTLTKGHNVPKRLPDEYQEVSYIGTSNITSKTHIDTGVVLQSVFTINAKVLWHTVPTTGAYQYHGHLNSSSSAQFGITATAAHYISSTSGANALSSNIAATANTVYNIRLKADGSTSTFTVNETTVTGNYTFSATNPYTSFIFGRNGSESYQNTWVNGKVYSYDISKDNVLVRYYVPCYRKADNVIGLYDLCGSICPLTGTPFYTNAGTGTFTKGADV